MAADELTTKMAADILEVSPSVIKRWCKQGVIPVHKHRGEYYFLRGELLQWGRKVSLLKGPGHRKKSGSPPLVEGVMDQLVPALERGGVFRDVTGETLSDFFWDALQHIVFLEEIDLKAIHSMLLEREAMASTAVGKGVALPHPRTPDVLQLEASYVALFYHEPRNDFKAYDQKSVTCSFFILATDTASHLKLMSQIAKALHQPEFIEAIHSQASLEDLLTYFNESNQ